MLQILSASRSRYGTNPAPAMLLQTNRAFAGPPELDNAGGERHLTSARPAARGPEPAEIPAIVKDVVRAPGQPLDAASRAFFEPRFGHDFSHVRLHNDARAAESARAVGALAYTVGRDVVFGAGQYAPATVPGNRLLAHELTHVVQQAGQDHNLRAFREDSRAPNPYEAEANRISLDVASRSPGPQVVRQRDSVPTLRRLKAMKFECSDFRGECPKDSEDYRDSLEAVNRMYATPAGKWLVQALKTNPNLKDTTITMRFATNIVRKEPGIQGDFYPVLVGESEYTVDVDLPAHRAVGTAQPQPPRSPLPKPVSTYGGGAVVIPSYVVERPSMLAETLFHELLHIWYVNTFGDLSIAHPDAPRWSVSGRPSTGHVHAERGEIEAPFAQRLKQFAVEIYRVETAARQPVAPPPAPAKPSAPPPPAPAGARGEVHEPGPRNLSFLAGVNAAATWLPPSSAREFSLDFRAGFLYGQANRLGASGDVLYLPGKGIVGIGGMAELRLLQTEDQLSGGQQIADNPLFFDLKAGATYVLRPDNPLVLSLGVGVGQEYGARGGWAPFWEVGAALQASPTAEMNQLGGTVGVTLGVRR